MRPNGCTFLVLRFEGITSLETDERKVQLAELNLCLTAQAQVLEDGIMREERVASSRVWEVLISSPTRVQGNQDMEKEDNKTPSQFGLSLTQLE